MAGISSTAFALRLFELVSLLLPVMVILLQTLIRFYDHDDDDSTDVHKARMLIAVLFGMYALFGAAWELSQFLNRTSPTSSVSAAVGYVQLALIVIGAISLFAVGAVLNRYEADFIDVLVPESLQEYLTGWRENRSTKQGEVAEGTNSASSHEEESHD